MGQEIVESQFEKRDFHRFEKLLREETNLLRGWFEEWRFSTDINVGGFELEACLVDSSGRPLPNNDRFMERLDETLVMPELARFNVELNTEPHRLSHDALALMHKELQTQWEHYSDVAEGLDSELVMTGILPSIRDSDLSLQNMSDLRRYHALNQQVLRMRNGEPLRLDISGREHLEVVHQDVMLESAATSFQIHMQVPEDLAVRYYNAAIIASAPMVAASANSPYLFGRDLWDETRIPLFEQAVDVGGFAGAAHGPMRRVGFGMGYARKSLFECFEENVEHFPIMLPIDYQSEPEELRHMRLHNGTIWRWNRPLIGFIDGKPHLRIEHRVVPSGPTVVDSIANAALFFGLITELVEAEQAPESQIEFATARDNFYEASRLGLHAHVNWIDGKRVGIHALLRDQLVPLAWKGLERLGLDQYDIDTYMEIIEARMRSGQNGAVWQREYVAKNGRDMQALTLAYLEHQKSGEPVHDWSL
ncbi:glutamate--cysteine ligase [Solemya pervernicosa gill symbiont]|uniref:Glutamate--cysteine ligase n=2 Tax=Gammaproteobacteria incertae sedis TaxID=118884 RepID=A0A1T2L4A1_9GAMM|nr:hypothetical protein [Candidatus Reidiella endopervernicosa]OOZ39945.1 glutamate--cysteine ligase [Solemya pervernicosa gill symbiont]QKQ25961.1 glutamate--cysteine ligase [Candidatus Reidiella endopervernicosa]